MQRARRDRTGTGNLAANRSRTRRLESESWLANQPVRCPRRLRWPRASGTPSRRAHTTRRSNAAGGGTAETGTDVGGSVGRGEDVEGGGGRGRRACGRRRRSRLGEVSEEMGAAGSDMEQATARSTLRTDRQTDRQATHVHTRTLSPASNNATSTNSGSRRPRLALHIPRSASAMSKTILGPVLQSRSQLRCLSAGAPRWARCRGRLRRAAAAAPASPGHPGCLITASKQHLQHTTKPVLQRISSGWPAP